MTNRNCLYFQHLGLSIYIAQKVELFEVIAEVKKSKSGLDYVEVKLWDYMSYPPLTLKIFEHTPVSSGLYLCRLGEYSALSH